MKNPLPRRIKAKNVKAEPNGSPAFVRNLYSMSVKNAEKSLSIASAIHFKFLHILYSFLSLSKF